MIFQHFSHGIFSLQLQLGDLSRTQPQPDPKAPGEVAKSSQCGRSHSTRVEGEKSGAHATSPWGGNSQSSGGFFGGEKIGKWQMTTFFGVSQRYGGVGLVA